MILGFFGIFFFVVAIYAVAHQYGIASVLLGGLACLFCAMAFWFSMLIDDGGPAASLLLAIAIIFGAMAIVFKKPVRQSRTFIRPGA